MVKYELTPFQLEQIKDIAEYLDCFLDELKEIMSDDPDSWGTYQDETGEATEYLLRQQYELLKALICDIEKNSNDNIMITKKIQRLADFCKPRKCIECHLRTECFKGLPFAADQIGTRIDNLYNCFVGIYNANLKAVLENNIIDKLEEL